MPTHNSSKFVKLDRWCQLMLQNAWAFLKIRGSSWLIVWLTPYWEPDRIPMIRWIHVQYIHPLPTCLNFEQRRRSPEIQRFQMALFVVDSILGTGHNSINPRTLYTFTTNIFEFWATTPPEIQRFQLALLWLILYLRNQTESQWF